MRLVLEEEPVSLTGGPSVKKVPKEDENNGYPTELNFEQKSLSSEQKSLSSVFMKNIMPTAEEVLQVAKAIKDENISAQLTAMLLGDPEWNNILNPPTQIVSATIPMKIFGKKKDKGWFSLISKPFPGLPKNFMIEAIEKKTGETIGTAEIMYFTHWKDSMVTANVYVKDEFQRRGVATAMYDFAEEITGKGMLPYSHQTSDDSISEDAKEFWKKRKPSLEWDE